MLRRAEYCITCSNIVRGEKRRGANNGYWRGGKTRANGYVYVRVSPEPGGAGGPYKAEHHIVWEEAHGLPLPDGWVIHHLNGIKDDNRPENLAAMPRNFHNPRLQFEPYQVRIHQLEAEVDELRKQIGTEL